MSTEANLDQTNDTKNLSHQKQGSSSKTQSFAKSIKVWMSWNTIFFPHEPRHHLYRLTESTFVFCRLIWLESIQNRLLCTHGECYRSTRVNDSPLHTVAGLLWRLGIPFLLLSEANASFTVNNRFPWRLVGRSTAITIRDAETLSEK